MIPISVAAELLDIHQRTLRIYDKEGILSPKRTLKNRRLYSQDDLNKCRLILFLTRNLALNLSAVRLVIRLLERDDSIEPKDYIKYIDEIANEANIDSKEQQENIIKTSKRGRRKKTEDK